LSAPALLLRPDWPTPPGVQAAMSLRAGGVSQPPRDGLNIGRSVGDDPRAVDENRARLVAALGVRPVWMHLVHGTNVLRLHAGGSEHPETPADAAWTSERGVACTVTAADCLPVFFALRDGSAVAAAHAGWRGLAAGVLEATLQALCTGMKAAPADVQAWLGPCIGPRQFEVGAEVLEAFGAFGPGEGGGAAAASHFVGRLRADGSAAWLADLRGLARARLQAAGVREISASTACTFEDASRFFSFRRDRITGRHAAAIWRA
jgi:YfiH family protein